MRKMTLKIVVSVFIIALILVVISNQNDEIINQEVNKTETVSTKLPKKKKKTSEERALYNDARNEYEYRRQVNPNTGKIPLNEKNLELKAARSSKLSSKSSASKISDDLYITRGPSNFGGRTRSLVIDKSDSSGNTIIAGGVSGGVFRTTNGGAYWEKVSPNDEIHNVTNIVQDPRLGFENIWYYSTGEGLGNSASGNGAFYFGQGIWQSADNGLSWLQIPTTNSAHEFFDNVFDIIYDLEVHPITGDLYAGVIAQIKRYNGTSWSTELTGTPSNTGQTTDVVITTTGRVYAAFSGVHDANIAGVWTSATGNAITGAWTRINEIVAGSSSTNPTFYFEPAGRIVLALAHSNENKLYILFDNGNISNCTTPLIEAGLWLWDQSTTSFTNLSNKLPDEDGCSVGNDPFAIQGGYDLAVNVKPDNENFVVIGGTNSYKIENITTDLMFSRIGGYASSAGYAQYTDHHPDIHTLVFNPFDSNILFSGSDGGVHKTNDVTASHVVWTSLNNNYQTFQFYHVGIDPSTGSDLVIGGAQDNGTKLGGRTSDLTIHENVSSGDGGAVAIADYTCSLSFYLSIQNGIMYRYCDGYAEITPRTYPSQFVTYFHLDPDNTNALYYASENTLLRTTDAEHVTQDTWTDLGNTTTAFGHTDGFEIFSTTRGVYNASTSYLLMGGNSGHIYRLDNPQNVINISSAVNITPPTATTLAYTVVTGLAIHPTNSNIVLATYSNYGIENIYLTTNATDASPTWTLVEGNLSSHSIRSAAIAEVDGETVYFVGTARGLYSTTAPLTTDWEIQAPDQIGFALVSSLSYRPADNHLLIGTHGNGMYEALIDSETLSVNKANDISSEISLFPNPVDQEINISIPTENGAISNYNIINTAGQSIMKGTLFNNKIDASQLASGMYIIQIDSGDKIGTKKFIKK
ncbi:MAG: T9SS type A sorting domain-containing protein [Algibacter sp.]